MNLLVDLVIAQETEEYASTCEGGFFLDDVKIQVNIRHHVVSLIVS